MHHSTLTTIQANGRAHHRQIQVLVRGLGKVVSQDPTRMGRQIRVAQAPAVVKKKVIAQNSPKKDKR